jgi:ribosomal protein S21
MTMNVRVEAKHFSKFSEHDKDRSFKILLEEFKKQVGAFGILPTLKEYRHFESKSRKARRKNRDLINKRKQDEIEEKLKRGEKIIENPSLVRKVRSRLKAKSKKKENKINKGKYVEEQKDHEYSY